MSMPDTLEGLKKCYHDNEDYPFHKTHVLLWQNQASLDIPTGFPFGLASRDWLSLSDAVFRVTSYTVLALTTT